MDNYAYFKAIKIRNLDVVLGIEDFIRFVNSSKIKQVFYLTDINKAKDLWNEKRLWRSILRPIKSEKCIPEEYPSNLPEYRQFFIVYNGGIYGTPFIFFQTLTEYKHAMDIKEELEKNVYDNFLNTFRQSSEHSKYNQEDYNSSLHNLFSNLDYYALFYHLYIDAKRRGFEDLIEYICQGITLGYKTPEDFHNAISMGFDKTTPASDYYTCLSKGFGNARIYHLWKNIVQDIEGTKNLINKEELQFLFELNKLFERYFNMSLANDSLRLDYKSFIEWKSYLLLLKILVETKENQSIKLSEICEKMDDFYKTHKILWIDRCSKGWHDYSFTIRTSSPTCKKEDIEQILEDIKKNSKYHDKISEAIKQLGYYDPRTKKFWKIRLSLKNGILIDGNNVAYFGRDKSRGDKPLLENVEVMLEELFDINATSNIVLWFDARFWRTVTDFDNWRDKMINKAKKSGIKLEIGQAPAGRSADTMLIKAALKNGMYIISNDQFREYNLPDLYRIGFSIINKKVIFDEKFNEMLKQTG